MIDIDISKMRQELADCQEFSEDEHDLTEGERYLKENVLYKCLYGIPLTVGEVNFDAFTEDDIVELIDITADDIEEKADRAYDIIRTFNDSKPQFTKEKLFF